MKISTLKLIIGFAVLLQLVGCTDRLSSVYVLEFPPAPDNWVSVLGQPCWKIEWFDKNGQIQSQVFAPEQTVEIELPVTWINPVTAFPFWTEHSLIPGSFKPAGAIFPFDVSDSKILISWEAGIDAVFYKELVFANSQNEKKIPSNFDWLRFRELIKSDVLNSAVIKDPWLVDWRYIAEKTIDSNFDRRRLVPQTVEIINTPVPSGTWYGSSPFSEPLFFPQEETPSFPVNSSSNVWVSSEGILRTSGKTWVYTAWKEKNNERNN